MAYNLARDNYIPPDEMNDRIHSVRENKRGAEAIRKFAYLKDEQKLAAMRINQRIGLWIRAKEIGDDLLTREIENLLHKDGINPKELIRRLAQQ